MDSRINAMRENGICTERLVMKPFELTDAEDMFEYTSDSVTCSFMRWGPHERVDQARAHIEHTINEDKEAINWGVYLQGKLIGAIRIYKINEEAGGSADISYILNRKYTGSGYMTECVHAAIHACGEKLGLSCVCADFVEGNEASRRVMERSGMNPDESAPPRKVEIKGKELPVYRYRVELSV